MKPWIQLTTLAVLTSLLSAPLSMAFDGDASCQIPGAPPVQLPDVGPVVSQYLSPDDEEDPVPKSFFIDRSKLKADPVYTAEAYSSSNNRSLKDLDRQRNCHDCGLLQNQQAESRRYLAAKYPKRFAKAGLLLAHQATGNLNAACFSIEDAGRRDACIGALGKFIDRLPSISAETGIELLRRSNTLGSLINSTIDGLASGDQKVFDQGTRLLGHIGDLLAQGHFTDAAARRQLLEEGARLTTQAGNAEVSAIWKQAWLDSGRITAMYAGAVASVFSVVGAPEGLATFASILGTIGVVGNVTMTGIDLGQKIQDGKSFAEIAPDIGIILASTIPGGLGKLSESLLNAGKGAEATSLILKLGQAAKTGARLSGFSLNLAQVLASSNDLAQGLKNQNLTWAEKVILCLSIVDGGVGLHQLMKSSSHHSPVKEPPPPHPVNEHPVEPREQPTTPTHSNDVASDMPPAPSYQATHTVEAREPRLYANFSKHIEGELGTKLIDGHRQNVISGGCHLDPCIESLISERIRADGHTVSVQKSEVNSAGVKLVLKYGHVEKTPGASGGPKIKKVWEDYSVEVMTNGVRRVHLSERFYNSDAWSKVREAGKKAGHPPVKTVFPENWSLKDVESASLKISQTSKPIRGSSDGTVLWYGVVNKVRICVAGRIDSEGKAVIHTAYPTYRQ